MRPLFKLENFTTRTYCGYSLSVMSTQLEEALKLPISERIKLVEDIWDSIAAESRALELTPEQKAELDRRIEYSRLNPEDVIPWETVKAEALARK